MKERSGFVGNSSVSSFCVWGWDTDTIPYCKLYKLIDPWDKEGNLVRIMFEEVQGPNGETIVGVGRVEDEIDHYMEEWWDYECKDATEEDYKLASSKAKELNLPAPKLYRWTGHS